MPPMRTVTLAACLVATLAACGDSETNPPVIDAPAAIDSSTAIDAAGQAQTGHEGNGEDVLLHARHV